MEISFDGARRLAYFFRAPARIGRRPLLVATNGYDATLYEPFLGQAAPALRRGHHCLIFDGPGQGAVLFAQGIRFALIGRRSSLV